MTGDVRLTDLFGEFARTMTTDVPIQEVVDRLVERIVDVLPISAAGVTLISPGSAPHYVAASDPSALHFERLQSELGEGPCTVAFETGRPVVVPHLDTDMRFPAFASRARTEGLGALFAFPLRHGDDRMGALDLYRLTPGCLNDEEMELAQTLADVASAYLVNAHRREQLEAAADRDHQASLHDPLTGLANRALFAEHLEHALVRLPRSDHRITLLFVDLDQFKSVNDRYGHAAGDAVLLEVADRLKELVRPGDVVARFGGDEFVILCDEIGDATQAEGVAERVGHALCVPFTCGDNEVVVTASVGVAMGSSTSGAAQLLDDADRAMYRAKRRGGGGHETIQWSSRGTP
jgi:diguanylate cyclase (GGDEF)-like protein